MKGKSISVLVAFRFSVYEHIKFNNLNKKMSKQSRKREPKDREK